MSDDTIRWGVLSTASISDSLIPGLLAADGCELAGIASRSRDRAEAAGLSLGAARAADGHERVHVARAFCAPRAQRTLAAQKRNTG